MIPVRALTMCSQAHSASARANELVKGYMLLIDDLYAPCQLMHMHEQKGLYSAPFCGNHRKDCRV